MSGGRSRARSLLAATALLALPGALRLGEYRALSGSADLPTGDGRPTLVFLFQPGDCRAYAGLVRRWNFLARESNLSVLGVGLGFGASASPVDSVLGEPQPRFPVRYDLTREGRRLLARLGWLETPTSVLVDARGRPLVIVPPITDGLAQRHAAMLVRAYARRLSRPDRRDETWRPRRTPPGEESKS